MPGTHVPVNTYRLQISAAFDLHAAARVLPYLHGLGVDWVYLSPILVAEPGSNHGYDVVAHDRIDPDRGGEEGLAALSAEARRLGMGVLVDVVPNHVGVASPKVNAWWSDVVENGRESPYADFFDIDWDHGDGRLRVPGVDGATDADLNYRRFFAVNSLAAVRVEDEEVFDATHVEIKRWFDEGLVDGLRVDHPDGLRDPGAYLDRLAELTGGAYVLVEKILEPGEGLLASWATAGTTGYDALGLIDRVLTDPAGQASLDALETRLRGDPVDWHQLIHDTKREVTDTILGPEIRRVARETGIEGTEVVDALAELAACFPVYRSYLPDGREHLDQTFAAARGRRPDLAAQLDELAPLLGDPANPVALRFQQTTGAVMAKGVEDCAFYRYSRLTSLTEVGGDPSEFSVSVEEFHAAMVERQERWPHAMTCLSTHDTKRGEDVRARITVLAELPDEWADALDRLLALAPVPDPGFGSLLWQAVLGAWSDDPDLRPRLHGYAEKAMREAGDRTTWTEPDAAFEAAVHAAVDAAFDDTEVRQVLDALLARVAEPGWSNSLAAKLLAITMVGVPDVYQGSELWEQSLVDPDNRRPVDFEHRAAVLSGERPDQAAEKLLVVRTALALRRDRPELFTGYRPVSAHGEAAGHAVAFDRGGVIAVATRLPLGLAERGGWGETTIDLPPGEWRDALTLRDASARLDELLATHPVALLVRS